MNDNEKYGRNLSRLVARFNSLQIGKVRTEVAKAFQLVVRLCAADHRGIVECVTCDTRGHYKTFDAGHYHKRRHVGTLFDFDNCHPQCKRCNMHLGGNDAKYAEFMRETYSIHRLAELELAKRVVIKFTREQLAEMKMRFVAMQRREMKRINQGELR